MLEEPESVIEGELRRGERLLWSGQPRQGIRLRLADALLIPLGILAVITAVFWQVAAFDIRDLFFTLWGIAFLLGALYLFFGRFLVDVMKRRNTYYGVTDERIIIVSGLLSRKVDSINLRHLFKCTVTEKRDGSGTITFDPPNPTAVWFGGGWWPGSGQFGAPTFDLIENVREVYDLIVTAQRTVRQ